VDLPRATKRTNRRAILDVLPLVPTVMPPTKESGKARLIAEAYIHAPESDEGELETLAREYLALLAERDALQKALNEFHRLHAQEIDERDALREALKNVRMDLEDMEAEVRHALGCPDAQVDPHKPMPRDIRSEWPE
jgi:predicted  nucleic acid-binding Zn-ribbon protein